MTNKRTCPLSAVEKGFKDSFINTYKRFFFYLKEQLFENSIFESQNQKIRFKRSTEKIRALKEWYETYPSNDLKKTFDDLPMV